MPSQVGIAQVGTVGIKVGKVGIKVVVVDVVPGVGGVK